MAIPIMKATRIFRRCRYLSWDKIAGLPFFEKKKQVSSETFFYEIVTTSQIKQKYFKVLKFGITQSRQ